MNDIIAIVFSILAGLVLGIFFYGGLYWTVKNGLSAKHPGLFFISSFWLRTLVTLVGFLWVSQGILLRLLTCMAGFVIVRGFSLYFERNGSRKHPFTGRV